MKNLLEYSIVEVRAERLVKLHKYLLDQICFTNRMKDLLCDSNAQFYTRTELIANVEKSEKLTERIRKLYVNTYNSLNIDEL